NVDVDRSVKGLQGLALDEIHQGISRQDAASLLGQRDQQRELVPGEGAFCALEAHDAGVAIDLESAEAQHVRRAARPPATQDRAQAGQQLSRLERLGKV